MKKTRLQVEREKLNLSKLKLSRMTGIAPSDLRCLEMRWTRLWPGWAKRLGEALGVPASKLMEEIENDE